MLKIEDLRECLNPKIDEKRKSRFEVAFRSLGYQDEYCRYHYEEYHKHHKLFLAAMSGKLSSEEIQNPQYYRIAFEANCFSFFRALHALIESIPYMLNLLIEVVEDSESRSVNWGAIISSHASTQFEQGVKKIKELRGSASYKELEHIANVSKHRRIVRIDSGMFSQGRFARFCADDFDVRFRYYEINELMESIYDELHPKALNLIKSFVC
ncbi:hypothetical protein [Pseudoalteromonas ruthenica]|uniref:hypothetical protein n=1 Tax=Pseudoalteromonas ruthenica TaxID=151081 RepID=UPI00241E80FF|nr:hypothetical protein [Pseudoalteromonas ruthenica]